MRIRLIVWLGVLALFALPAFSEQINFTGGVVTFWDGTTATTNNAATYYGVANYVEGNFKAEFEGSHTTTFESIIGNYEGGGNDVIHGHWTAGGLGGLNKIIFTRTDGAAFDLNYFVLTSNTAIGGGGPTGTEKAYIHASSDGVTDDYKMLLPPDAWGWPGHQILLGPQFDSIKAFWFDVESPVQCFGMDMFYINEPAPPIVPEPATWLLLATGLGTLKLQLKRLRRH